MSIFFKKVAHKAKIKLILNLMKILIFFSYSFTTLAAKNEEQVDWQKKRIQEDILNSPFSYNSINFNINEKKNFYLLEDQQNRYLKDLLDKILKEKDYPEFITWKENKSSQNEKFMLPKSQDKKKYSIRFYLNNIAFCDHSVSIYLLKNMQTLILGKILEPNISYYFDEEIFPSWRDTILNLHKKIRKKHGPYRQVKVKEKEKCFTIQDETLLPIWRAEIDIDGKPYLIEFDQNIIYSLQKSFFSLNLEKTGKGQIFSPDNFANELILVDLLDLDGSGYLTNTYFSTLMYDKSLKPLARAYSEDLQFVYESNDYRFDATSLFYNANKILNFFKEKLNYKWEGPKITIIGEYLSNDFALEKENILADSSNDIRVSISQNNALYVPESKNLGPQIIIASGDGHVLKNLTRDPDVIFHEFSHHIIYRTLKNTAGESLVLHEGLADYFTFHATDNSCLGENICTNDSQVCWEKNTCLRIANSMLEFNGDLYNQLGAHYQGQAISALLWSLRDSIDKNKLLKIIYKALEYLEPASGIKHYLLALGIADYELYSSENTCTIFTEAESRGFGSLLTEINCKQNEQFKSENKETLLLEEEKPAPEVKQEDKNDSFFGQCATLPPLLWGKNTHGNKNNLFFYLFFSLLPCLLSFTLRKKNHYNTN